MATKMNYAEIQNHTDFNQKRNALAKRGKVVKSDYVTFVGAGIKFFYGEGTQNIQIINDLVDMAYDCGYNGGHMVDWFAQVIGHAVKKVGKRYHFAKKDPGRNVEIEHVDKFLRDHGNPFEWQNGGNRQPKAFDLGAATASFLAKLEKNGYSFEDVVSMYNEKFAA